MVTGTVVQFRRGRKTFKPRHFLIEVEDFNKREDAKGLVGKKVVWTSTGENSKKIEGVVSSAHGNKGVIRAIFERGLPGQAIGTPVEIDAGKKINQTSPQKDKVEKKKETVVEKVEDAIEEVVEEVKEDAKKIVEKVKEVAKEAVAEVAE